MNEQLAIPWRQRHRTTLVLSRTRCLLLDLFRNHTHTASPLSSASPLTNAPRSTTLPILGTQRRTGTLFFFFSITTTSTHHSFPDPSLILYFLHIPLPLSLSLHSSTWP